MSRVIRWAALHKFLSLLILAGLVGAGYVLLPDAPESPYETAVAERATLVQDVSVTGRVESDESVDLAFEKSGRITSVLAEVGDLVSRGEALLRLDGSDLEASLAQAEANVAFEEANLAKLVRGARPEEIQVSEIALENARRSLTDAEASLVQTLLDAYTKADDAVRNKTDKFFNNPRTNPELSIPATDAVLAIELAGLRRSLEGDLVSWSEMTGEFLNADVAQALAHTKTYLGNVKTLLERLAFGVNGLLPSSSLSQATIDAWKADVSAARIAVNAALSATVASEEKWRGASSAVLLASQELNLKKIGAAAEDLAAQRAKIASAKASVSSYRAQIGKLALTAPFAGVVTMQDGKLGALASAGTPIVTIQSKGAFAIKANVPEVDIAKLSAGDLATITLDAYGEDRVFTGIVAAIDPAERIIDGVPTYQVTLHFEDKDGLVRSGMTASVHIETDRAEGVVAIPARAIDEKDGKKLVRVLLAGGARETREVAIGLRASDGRVAVLSGVSEGEHVITFDKTAQ